MNQPCGRVDSTLGKTHIATISEGVWLTAVRIRAASSFTKVFPSVSLFHTIVVPSNEGKMPDKNKEKKEESNVD